VAPRPGIEPGTCGLTVEATLEVRLPKLKNFNRFYRPPGAEPSQPNPGRTFSDPGALRVTNLRSNPNKNIEFCFWSATTTERKPNIGTESARRGKSGGGAAKLRPTAFRRGVRPRSHFADDQSASFAVSARSCAMTALTCKLPRHSFRCSSTALSTASKAFSSGTPFIRAIARASS